MAWMVVARPSDSGLLLPGARAVGGACLSLPPVFRNAWRRHFPRGRVESVVTHDPRIPDPPGLRPDAF